MKMMKNNGPKNSKKLKFVKINLIFLDIFEIHKKSFFDPNQFNIISIESLKQQNLLFKQYNFK